MTIELCDLTKRFGHRTVVDDLSMVIQDGGLTVLLGPSGCGKTTTLRMIAGLERNDGGQIVLDGKDVTALSPKERGVAMVFQDYGLYPHMSVLQNVAFPLRIAGVKRAERNDAAMAMLKRLRIDHLAPQRPGKISGGEKQRVSIARALVRRPRILLMDEPLSNLDAMLRVSMRTEIKQLHQEFRTTTLYVTHDQIEAMSLGTAIAVMKNGRIEQYGPPTEIYDRPSSLFVGLFVGSPSMNVFPVTLQTEAGETALCAEKVRIPVEAAFAARLRTALGDKNDAIVGVRPDDFAIGPVDPASDSGLVGEVQLVERLGQDNYIHLDVGDKRVVCRFPGDRNYEPGQGICLQPRETKIHVFDPRSAVRID